MQGPLSASRRERFVAACARSALTAVWLGSTHTLTEHVARSEELVNARESMRVQMVLATRHELRGATTSSYRGGGAQVPQDALSHTVSSSLPTSMIRNLFSFIIHDYHTVEIYTTPAVLYMRPRIFWRNSEMSEDDRRMEV